MSRVLLCLTSVIVFAILLAVSLPEADGCASVPPLNGPPVSIAEESAIIVWDPVKKVQHFIRRAAFDTKSPDFGFLVPTPSLPKLPLETVEDGAFRQIDQWMLPKTVEETRWRFEPRMCIFFADTKDERMMDAPKSAVQVLHEQKVGGFDVSVLEADDAEELTRWIKDHGYSADPELYDWLKPYVAGKWKITAFKISQDPKTGQLATTKAVRMSFATDRPFFPYREPEGKKKEPSKHKDPSWFGSRLLRVLFVSDTRVDGKLGNQAWHAKVPWANQLTDEQRQQMIKETGVPESDVPAKAWLTSFEDRASPRPGREEVYFDPAQDRSPIEPPPFIKYHDVWLPIDCILFGVLLVGLVALPIAVKIWRRMRT